MALQKNQGLEQLQSLPPGMRVHSPQGDFDDGPDGFLDTAAIMACCDLVITSDTAIAHLAGATGTPAWLALQKNAEWRWLRERADSPWYASLRLFRQGRNGDWKSVFGAMERILAAEVRA